LSIGVHLTTLIIIPALFIFYIIIDKEKRFSPLFWLTWFALFSVAISFNFFVYTMSITLVITLVGALITRKKNWVIAFLTLLVTTMAFTVNGYAMVRSRTNPAIDENNPETWAKFEDYIDRKQYGSESMWEKMFKRRAKAENQFGTHPRMGFWGFYWVQYTEDPKHTIYGFLPFIIAIWGMIVAMRKRFSWGSLLFMTAVVSTLGLIIYINFSDGTVSDHLEVRDRITSIHPVT
jgi:drug/metabolite transporter (DMT)-like permease